MDLNINQKHSKAISSKKEEKLIDMPLVNKTKNKTEEDLILKTQITNSNKTQDFEFLYW